MKAIACIAALTATVFAVSCRGGKPAPPPTDTPRDHLVNRLMDSVRDGKILYGHQDDLVYGHSWLVEDPAGDPLERSDVKEVSGKYPAVVGFDLGGIELGSGENLDGVPFDLMRRAAATHAARGGVVTFSWHPRNPLTGGDAWDISSDEVVASVLEGGEKHSEFLLWLTRAADFLGSIKDAEGNRVPVIFRPWHENIGSWFWWGGKLCTPEQYIELYRMTWTYLTKVKGLDNILWCYSPNSNIDAPEYMSRYPGDEFVDMFGVDAYVDTWGGKLSVEEAGVKFSESVKHCLTYMTAISTEHKKLMCLSETGFEGIPDPSWWTGVLYPAIQDFSIAYVLTWRNAHDRPGHYYAPWPGSADTDDFKTFSEKEQIVLL